MDITPLVPEDRQVVASYGGGGFLISSARFEGSVIILPERTLPWSITDTAAIDYASLAPVTDALPPVEVLLVGCGARMTLLPAALRQRLRRQGIGLETMDTGAACRTYNVLLAESRRVAAALLAV